MDITQTTIDQIADFYEENIKTEFGGYVNEKHKEDCVNGIIELMKFVNDNDITFEQWKSDVDIYDDSYEIFSNIPLYLETVTDYTSEKILEERKDNIMKFIISIYALLN